jgi:hypothetical protein
LDLVEKLIWVNLVMVVQVKLILMSIFFWTVGGSMSVNILLTAIVVHPLIKCLIKRAIHLYIFFVFYIKIQVHVRV